MIVLLAATGLLLIAGLVLWLAERSERRGDRAAMHRYLRERR